jgi:hypothetical protein
VEAFTSLLDQLAWATDQTDDDRREVGEQVVAEAEVISQAVAAMHIGHWLRPTTVVQPALAEAGVGSGIFLRRVDP